MFPMATENAAAPAVTELLRAVEAGSPGARDELITAVYGEMHRVARRTLSGGRACHVVSPTALVHGTALKLMVQQKLSARDRAHFVAYSAQMMRQVLIDHLRRDGPTPRGGTRVTLVSTLADEAKEELDFEALHAALEKLSAVSFEHARLVELRYFGGMTLDEIAELDGTSSATVHHSWRAARAWLHDALKR